jgi:uncharacterized protein DUF1580
MPIDTKIEGLISLAAAARLLPERRRGKRPHISCMYRWTTKGCRGVILESVMVGGTRCTSREALTRFISRLTNLQQSGPAPISTTARREHLDTIEQQLDTEGFN